MNNIVLFQIEEKKTFGNKHDCELLDILHIFDTFLVF